MNTNTEAGGKWIHNFLEKKIQKIRKEVQKYIKEVFIAQIYISSWGNFMK